MNFIDNNFKQIDREVVTKATILDIKLDECKNPIEYKKLLDEYQSLLSKYDLFEKPFTEDASQSDYHELREEDFNAIIVNRNGKYGVQETRYFHGLDSVYDSIEQFGVSNLFKVCYNGLYGIIDLHDGTYIIPVEYDSLLVHEDNHFCVIAQKSGRYKYFEDDRSSDWMEEIAFPEYAGWITARQGNEHGWLDENMEFTSELDKAHIHILPEVIRVDIFKQRHVATREDLNRCSELERALRTSNEEEKKSLKAELFLLSGQLSHSYRLYSYFHKGQEGLKDQFGSIIVPAIYDEIKTTSKGIIVSYFGRTGKLWGKIAELDKKIEFPIIEYDDPTHEFGYSDWTIVKKNGKFGIYSTIENKYSLEPVYDEFIENEGYHHIITRIGDKFGFFDEEFNIAPKFEDYHIGRSLSFVRFMLNGKWGYINRQGEWTEKIEKARAYTRNPMFFFQREETI